MEPHLIRILVADRDDLARAGIAAILGRCSEEVFIEDARDFVEFEQKLTVREYDLVILEPLFCRQDIDESIKRVKEIAPRSNLLIFTTLDDQTHGIRAISSGARGYLLKTCSLEEFSVATKRVRSGNVHISAALAEKIATQINDNVVMASPYESLTQRELDVHAMLVCGKRIVEIAELLQLSQKTVSTYKSRILLKFGVTTLTDIFNYTVSHGLVDSCQSRLEGLNGNKHFGKGRS